MSKNKKFNAKILAEESPEVKIKECIDELNYVISGDKEHGLYEVIQVLQSALDELEES